MSDVFEQGFLAVPRTEGQFPAVIVIHAWWGLNDFFKQLCDRLAQAGFVAFAPDLYEGRVATTIDEAKAYRGKVNKEKARNLLHRSVNALQQRPQVASKALGLIGFSWGANQALGLLEERSKDIQAVVVFYGTRTGTYEGTQAAVLGHYAEADDYVAKSGQQKFEKALKKAAIDTTFYEYPNTGHWFFESNQSAFEAAAAELAWQRTVDFLRQQLASGS